MKRWGCAPTTWWNCADQFTASFFVGSDQEQNQKSPSLWRRHEPGQRVPLASRRLGPIELVVISPNDPVAMLNYAREYHEDEYPFRL